MTTIENTINGFQVVEQNTMCCFFVNLIFIMFVIFSSIRNILIYYIKHINIYIYTIYFYNTFTHVFRVQMISYRRPTYTGHHRERQRSVQERLPHFVPKPSHPESFRTLLPTNSWLFSVLLSVFITVRVSLYLYVYNYTVTVWRLHWLLLYDNDTNKQKPTRFRSNLFFIGIIYYVY